MTDAGSIVRPLGALPICETKRQNILAFVALICSISLFCLKSDNIMEVPL